MFEEVLSEICKFENPLRFPFKSRDVNRIVKLMKPFIISHTRSKKIYAWFIIDRGVQKVLYKLGEGFSVKFKQRSVYDLLSGLRLTLKFPEGYVDECLVWFTIWKGTFFEVRFTKDLSIYYCSNI